MHANALLRPKALPLDPATKKYQDMTDYQRYNAFLAARRRARRTLWRQKCRTGVGILGQPLTELVNDPKYGADYEAESLRAGEKLAEASLTAELMVCNLAKAPHKGRTGSG